MKMGICVQKDSLKIGDCTQKHDVEVTKGFNKTKHGNPQNGNRKKNFVVSCVTSFVTIKQKVVFPTTNRNTENWESVFSLFTNGNQKGSSQCPHVSYFQKSSSLNWHLVRVANANWKLRLEVFHSCNVLIDAFWLNYNSLKSFINV